MSGLPPPWKFGVDVVPLNGLINGVPDNARIHSKPPVYDGKPEPRCAISDVIWLQAQNKLLNENVHSDLAAAFDQSRLELVTRRSAINQTNTFAHDWQPDFITQFWDAVHTGTGGALLRSPIAVTALKPPHSVHFTGLANALVLWGFGHPQTNESGQHDLYDALIALCQISSVIALLADDLIVEYDMLRPLWYSLSKEIPQFAVWPREKETSQLCAGQARREGWLNHLGQQWRINLTRHCTTMSAIIWYRLGKELRVKFPAHSTVIENVALSAGRCFLAQ